MRLGLLVDALKFCTEHVICMQNDEICPLWGKCSMTLKNAAMFDFIDRFSWHATICKQPKADTLCLCRTGIMEDPFIAKSFFDDDGQFCGFISGDNWYDKDRIFCWSEIMPVLCDDIDLKEEL